MSINSLFFPTDYNLLSLFQDTTSSIDIPVEPGEVLTPEELLRRVVLNALGTSEVGKADEFIKQSGVSLDQLPPLGTAADGQKFYRVPVDAEFRKSIGSFIETGKALPLGKLAATQNNKPSQEIDNSNPGNETQPTTIERKTIRGSNGTGAKQTVVRQRQVSATQPKKVEYYTAQEIDKAKQGLDHKDFTVALTAEDLEALEKVTDGDPRLELFKLALSKFRYDPRAIDEAAKGIDGKELTDSTAKVWLGGPDHPASAEEIKTWIKDAQAGKARSTFTLSAESRQKAFLADLRLKGGDEAVSLYQHRLKVEEELKSIDDQFNKVPVYNNLQRSFLELAREQAKKDAIDRLTNEINFDLREDGTENERLGNGFADGLEKTMEFYVNSNPIYRFLPEAARKQIVNFGVGIGLGTVQLAGAVKGADDFFRDAAQDALIYAAEKTGVDQTLGIDLTKVKQDLASVRRQDSDVWRNLMNARTRDMAKGDFGYQTKQDYHLPIKPYDVPNWSVRGGEMTVKALPFLVVAVATDGASIPASMAVMGTVSGTLAGGETYAQTRTYVPALKSAAFGAVQGSVAPLTARLGIGPDVALNAATGFVMTKIQNPNANDAEIIQGIVLQTAQSGAFHIGSSLHQTLTARAGRPLTEVEAQQQFKQIVSENLPAIKEEVATSAKTQVESVIKQTEVEVVGDYLERQASQVRQQKQTPTDAKVGVLQAQGIQSKARLSQQAAEIFANWGKDNTLFTRAKYEQAGITLRTNNAYSVLPGVVPPEVLSALSVKAGYHVEAGVRGFKEFARVMKAEAESAGISWSSVRPRLEGIYREAMAKVGLDVNEKQINSLTKEFVKEVREEAKSTPQQKAIADFRKKNEIPDFTYLRNENGEATGTVAMADGEFGTNTILGREKLGTDNKALRQQALDEIQTKLGKLQGETYGKNKAEFLTHAEAELLIKLAEKNGGKLGEKVEMYVDRPTCPACRGTEKDLGVGLSVLAELYGVKELTVHDSYGTTYVIRPNQTTEVIK